MLSGGIIFFLSAFFFLGTQEEHQTLKENLSMSFISRFLGMSTLVLAISLTIFLLNLIIQKIRPEIQGNRSLLEISINSLLILTLFNLVGLMIFFFH